MILLFKDTCVSLPIIRKEATFSLKCGRNIFIELLRIFSATSAYMKSNNLSIRRI